MADNIKGITIEIAGDTSRLDNALRQMNKSLKTTQNELKSVEKSLKFDPSNVALLTQKQKLLTDAVKQTTEKLDALKKAKKEADKDSNVDKNSEEYRKLEREISYAEGSLKRYKDQLKQTNREVLSSKLGLTDLSKNFKDLGNNLTTLGNSLKGISATASAVVGSLSAITLSAGKNADEITTLAKQYNLTTDQIQAFQLASDLIDVDLSTITGAYSKLTKAMTSKSASEELAKMGVAVKDADGNLRSANDVFNDTIKALGKIENETQRDSVAMSIFGKSAMALNPLIEGGADELARFTKYLEENSLLMSTDQLDALNGMNNALDVVKATLKGVGSDVASVFAEPFTEAFNKVNEVILKVKEKFDELDPSFVRIGGAVLTVVASLAPLLLAFGKISKAIGGIIGMLGASGATGGLASALGALTNPITLAVAGFALLFTQSEQFREGVMEVVETIKTNMMPILQNVANLITAYIIPALRSLWSWFKDNILPIIKSIGESLKDILVSALQTFFNVVSNVVGILGSMFSALSSVWGYLKDAGVVDTLSEGFRKLGEFIANVVEWVKSLVEWFGNLISKIAEVTSGLVGFISNGISNLGSFVGGLFSSGGYMSGGYMSGGVVVNSTINVTNNGNNISEYTLKKWSEMLVDDINEQLGRMI